MKKSVLIAIIIIPLVAFSFDQAIQFSPLPQDREAFNRSQPGGEVMGEAIGPENSYGGILPSVDPTSGSEMLATEPEPLSPPPQMEPLIQEKGMARIGPGASVGRDYKVLKEHFRSWKKRRARHYNNHIPSLDKLVPKSVKAYLDQELLEKMKESHPFQYLGLSPKMFSRCPSIYKYRLIPNQARTTIYPEGMVYVKVGCMPHVFAPFRFDLDEDVVEMKLPGHLGYVSVDEYLSIYKAVMDS